MKALGIAATGMMAQQTNVDVISNNIANANTTGFKSSRAAFQDLIYQSMERAGAATSEAGTARPIGVDIGLGVQTAGTVRLNTQGGLVRTDNQTNIAIDGQGFFEIEMPDGTPAYTRDGTFQLSAEGELVTMQGYRVQPGIVFPENTVSIEINEEGTVLAYEDGDPNAIELGQITMANFINPAGMRAVGDNFLLQTEASGEAQVAVPGDPGFGVLRQGFVESSNVDVIRQITDLIQAQRAYEMNSKAIETADQMLNAANQVR
ncbi:flagellar basal-body rod protein FlgG [Palleronia salina]|uniref:Flagellar basal-body rod protein FlgG n=2 Tax=Palleronia TaxID=315422 RepID=A0A1M6CZQ1_9RHOB|nr:MULTISPECIES: flagellar basal-body rod protein FlgG [Palleronia]SEN26364.1 flagellar basal-body rod protein FlgG [Palleronia pelagia]SHI66502.1 flagellar basal-body rod protein FlgG [Palleronia salina]